MRWAYPVIFKISTSNWSHLKNLYPRIASFEVEHVKIRYLNAENMADIVYDKFRKQGFIFQKNIKGRLTKIFAQALDNPDIRLFPEGGY